MKKGYTKILLVALVGIMLLTGPLSASAAMNDSQTNEVMPRLTYIMDSKTSLTIDNNTAIVDCWVNGSVIDATKAKVIAELQVKSGNNWIAYSTWTDTQYDYEAAVYETKSVKSGNTYRVKATFTVWEGSQSESIVVFTDEVTA